MPAGCVKCANGEIQCGSDTSELCAGSGGWTKAGALCLQFWTRQDSKKNCLILVDIKPLDSCDGNERIVIPAASLVTSLVSKPKRKPLRGKKR